MSSERKDASEVDPSTAPTATAVVDPVAEAIGELRESLAENARDEQRLDDQLARLEKERRSGLTWRDVFDDEHEPVLALLGTVVRRLSDAGAALRRAMALALVSEGESLPAVARRLGVTRQRVFALVRGTRQP